MNKKMDNFLIGCWEQQKPWIVSEDDLSSVRPERSQSHAYITSMGSIYKYKIL